MRTAIAGLIGATFLVLSGSGSAQPLSAPSGKPLLTWAPKPYTGTSGLYDTGLQVEAGSTYTFVVSGLWTNTGNGGSVTQDPFFTVTRSDGCTSCPEAGSTLDMKIKGYKGFFTLGVDDPAQTIAYNSSHSYQATFVPPASGTLELQNPLVYGNGHTVAGEVTIQMYGAQTSTTPTPTPTTAEQATVAQISGEVNYRHGPNGPLLPVTSSTKLGKDDQIETGVDSNVVLAFSDGSRMQLDQMTQLLVADVLNKGSRQAINVRLKLGDVSAQVNPKHDFQSSFELTTPPGTTSVRGSEMRVFYDPAAKTTIAATLQDVATFTPAREKQPLNNSPAGPGRSSKEASKATGSTSSFNGHPRRPAPSHRGEYTGTIAAGTRPGQGEITKGLAWDPSNPSVKVTWTGSGHATCTGDC